MNAAEKPVASARRAASTVAARRIVLALTLVFASGSALADDEVRIIIRSFIPSMHPGNPGYMRPIPGQAGKFMIPGPLGGKCFDTDHRMFTSDPGASSRVASDLVLKAGPTPSVRAGGGGAIARIATSVERDCASGKETRRDTAKASGCTNGAPAYAADLHQTQVVVTCQVGNPLTPPGTPRIDYGGTFTFDTQAKTLAFRGDVGLFPAFESYASLNGGAWVTVFRVDPQGKDATWLYDLGLGLTAYRLDVGPVKLR